MDTFLCKTLPGHQRPKNECAPFMLLAPFPGLDSIRNIKQPTGEKKTLLQNATHATHFAYSHEQATGKK